MFMNQFNSSIKIRFAVFLILICGFVLFILSWRKPFRADAPTFLNSKVASKNSGDILDWKLDDIHGKNRFFEGPVNHIIEMMERTESPNNVADTVDSSSNVDDDDVASLYFLNMELDSENMRIGLYEKLARKYLAPWLALPQSSKNLATPVTQRMLNLMEYVYKGGAFRVRYVNGKLIYRVLIKYQQTYRFNRMCWLIGLLSEMDKEGLLKENFDVILYVGDGPKVPIDTFDKFAGFPLFSIRSSPIHIDIPIPDPVVYGSNGNYQWPSEAISAVPWEKKMPTAVFRGKASCLKMQADNWHACNRVKAAKLSNELQMAVISRLSVNSTLLDAESDDNYSLLDIGITEWNQIDARVPGSFPVHNDGYGLIPPPKVEEVEQSTGVKTVQFMDYMTQSKYKYILDLDGGLGSSRKAGILSSGSVLIAQDSPWKNWYDPCLKPYYHYIPFDHYLSNLMSRVKWARAHDAQVKKMVQAAQDFSRRFLSRESAKAYFSALLNIYAKEMLVDKEKIDDKVVELNYCDLTRNREIPHGPLGCSQGWFVWDDISSPVFWKNYVRRINQAIQNEDSKFY